MSLLVPICALLGLALGPSLHHAAVRAGSRLPFQGLGPRCSECSTPRAFPSWHRRRCPSCGTVGRPAELWTGTAAAILFAGAALVAGPTWVLPAMLAFAAVTLVLVVTDLDHKLIPNRVLYPGGGVASVLLVLGAVVEGRAGDLPRAAVGGVAYFGVLFLVALVARGGFGFGDVKLGALLGAFTAFQSLETFLLGIFFTGVAGGLPAILLLVSRRAGRKDELPYGPAMVVGTWAALVLGEAFLGWYRG